MFHGHVETLFDHRVLIGDVGTWADVLVSGWLVNVAVLSLILESLLAGVEDNCILEVAVARLAEG